MHWFRDHEKAASTYGIRSFCHQTPANMCSSKRHAESRQCTLHRFYTDHCSKAELQQHVKITIVTKRVHDSNAWAEKSKQLPNK